MLEKPVAERLQVKNGRRLAVLGASPGLDHAIGAADLRAPSSQADVILLFAPDRATLGAALPRTMATMREAAILWIGYPKLSSPIAADLSRDTIRALVSGLQLDTVSQIAIDADWSALRLKRV